MDKLYYSDGREVKNGDIVKDTEFQPLDKYDDRLFYIGVHDDHYSLSTSMGNLGQIDSVEGYELVGRKETKKVQALIQELEHLYRNHTQSYEFNEFITKAIDALIRAKHKIK
jgi:hypothetical protein